VCLVKISCKCDKSKITIAEVFERGYSIEEVVFCNYVLSPRQCRVSREMLADTPLFSRSTCSALG
jgi:hypothetical protein